MSITTSGGGTLVTGKSIRTYQLLALAQALKLEQHGLKRRGKSALMLAREATGLKTRDRDVLATRLRHMAHENEMELSK